MPIAATITWTPVPGSYGTFVEYKKVGDASWTVPVSPANPTLYSSYPLSLDAGFYYDIRLTTQSNICANGYVIKRIFVSGGAECCPAGYTISPDGTYCYEELTEPATPTGSGLTVCHFTSAADYGNYGAVIYKLGKYNVDGTWNVSDPTAKPENIGLGTGLGYNASAFNTTTIAVPHVWLNSDFVSAVDSRLNRTGLWRCANQTYTGTLGFSRQIDITTAKVYYIGLGADNYAELKVNGVTILSQDITALSGATYFNMAPTGFRFWHIYPVYLNSGPNILSLTGTNTGSIGIMGFEIYDATEGQLMAVTTDAGLNDYIIFSTKDIFDGEPSDIGNYTCATPGYTLVYDPLTSEYICKLINSAPTIDCTATEIIYYGIDVPDGTTPDEAEILAGSSQVGNGAIDVAINWGTPDGVPKYYWLAIPASGPTYLKNRWSEVPPNNGNMGTISDLFNAPATVSVLGIPYYVWITNYQTSFTANPYTFSKV